jgi:hypothetical protein
MRSALLPCQVPQITPRAPNPPAFRVTHAPLIRLAGGRSALYVLSAELLPDDFMNTPAQPDLEPGRAYRTRELRQWSANPTRLAHRLIDEGKLRQAARGIFYAPIPTRFGPAPPPSEELLRASLNGDHFFITGPPYWNALGLGATAIFAVTLVYNTRRSAELRLGERRGARYVWTGPQRAPSRRRL